MFFISIFTDLYASQLCLLLVPETYKLSFFFKQHRVRYTFGGAGAWNCGNWSQWDGGCNGVTRQWLAFSEHAGKHWVMIHTLNMVGWLKHAMNKVFPEASFHYFSRCFPCFEECAGHFWWAWFAGLREQKWCHGPLHHSGRVHDVASGRPLHPSAMANLKQEQSEHRSTKVNGEQQKVGAKMKHTLSV